MNRLAFRMRVVNSIGHTAVRIPNILYEALRCPHDIEYVGHSQQDAADMIFEKEKVILGKLRPFGVRRLSDIFKKIDGNICFPFYGAESFSYPYEGTPGWLLNISKPSTSSRTPSSAYASNCSSNASYPSQNNHLNRNVSDLRRCMFQFKLSRSQHNAAASSNVEECLTQTADFWARISSECGNDTCSILKNEGVDFESFLLLSREDFEGMFLDEELVNCITCGSFLSCCLRRRLGGVFKNVHAGSSRVRLCTVGVRSGFLLRQWGSVAGLYKASHEIWASRLSSSLTRLIIHWLNQIGVNYFARLLLNVVVTCNTSALLEYRMIQSESTGRRKLHEIWASRLSLGLIRLIIHWPNQIGVSCFVRLLLNVVATCNSSVLLEYRMIHHEIWASRLSLGLIRLIIHWLNYFRGIVRCDVISGFEVKLDSWLLLVGYLAFSCVIAVGLQVVMESEKADTVEDLIAAKSEMKSKLRALEQQIYDFEETFLKEATNYSYKAPQPTNSTKLGDKPRYKKTDRIFSYSSVTSPNEDDNFGCDENVRKPISVNASAANTHHRHHRPSVFLHPRSGTVKKRYKKRRNEN
uniref:Chromatin modification-related protein MEAF6 n=1 Tax=Syphacia muris TaxID=451379 RepID=A0A0N5AZ20_9BILA